MSEASLPIDMVRDGEEESEAETLERRHQELLKDRNSLVQEQNELLARLDVEHDAVTMRKSVDVQHKLFATEQEIHTIMSRTTQRQLKELRDSRLLFEKYRTSTPSARRSLTFAEEPDALLQVIEASTSLSRNLLRIDQCKPTDGQVTITSTVYHRWRNMLLSTVGEMSEQEKESFFRKSAGSNLLDVLEMLPETQLVDAGSDTPFSDIIKRLDCFFESDGMKRSARLELETMKQDALKNESNMSFLERVMKAAMNCNFPKSEFDERLMNVISKNSRDKKIREAANEIDRNGKRYTYTQFRDFILQLELFRDNEKLHKEDGIKSKQLSVHEVHSPTQQESGMNRSSYQPAGARSFHQRDPSRARSSTFQRGQLGRPVKACYRCGSRAHDPMGCPHRSKTCYNCNRVGHMQNQCTVPVSSKRVRSPQPTKFGSGSKKKRVENVEAKPDDINQVRSESDCSSDD